MRALIFRLARAGCRQTGAARKFLSCFFLTGLLLTRLAAADEATPKTHTLFMGADIDVWEGSTPRRVEGVSAGSFLVKVDGREKKVPMKFTKVKMKVAHSLKLSEMSVKVENLEVDRGYTAANDPNLKFLREASGAVASDAQVERDTRRMLAANGNNAMAGTLQSLSISQTDIVATDAYGITAAERERQSFDTMQAYNNSSYAMGSDLNSSGASARKLAGELADGLYDAIEIQFRVSSPQTLNSPYAVVMAEFAAPGAKPNEVQSWVYATELDPITPETRKVRIKEGGFPPGFVLKSYQVHLYNRGHELASSVASKRVELTRDEAFDYLLLDYLATNKGKTLPATLAMGRLSAQVRNDARAGDKLFVQVDKDGKPVAAFADEACKQRLADPALEAELAKLRFKPALKEGKTVAGVARLGS